MIIGVNCGHTVSGQPGCGAVGYIDESVETRRVGKALMELLRRAGHTVVDCTNDYAKSTNANLAEIVRIANAQPLDLFVSIHFNSGGGHGTEVYTYNGRHFDAAENTLSAVTALGFTNRGIKKDTDRFKSGMYVIRHTSATAMLVEVCFVDSKADTDHYKEIGPDVVAQAICRGITGTAPEEKKIEEYTDPNDIVWELGHRGIVNDTDALLSEIFTNPNGKLYWLAHNIVQYLRERD